MRTITLLALVLLVGLGVTAQDDTETPIRQLVLSGDATIDAGYLAVVVGAQTYLYNLHDLETAPQVFEMRNDYGGIGLNPDGSLLAVPGECNELDVLDVETEERLAVVIVDHPYCEPLRLTFSHDGTLVYVHNDGYLYRTQDILDAGRNDAGQALLQAEEVDIGEAAFSADDRLLAYAQPSGVIGVYDVPSGERLLTIAPTAYMRSNRRLHQAMVFSADGVLLAAVVHRGPTNLFDVATGDLLMSYWQDTEVGSIAVWAEDGSQIRSVHRGNRGVTYWRVYMDLTQTLDDVPPTELDTLNPAFGSFSTDGSLLVIVTDDNTLALHDGTDGTLLDVLTVPDG